MQWWWRVTMVWLGVGVVVRVGWAGGPMEEVCPVDWQAVSLGEAVRGLATRLEVPYLLDGSVTDGVLERRIRLFAAHLNGRQAFRWTVRSAGLEAVLVDGVMLVARPERLPATWRLSGAVGSGVGAATTAVDPRWTAARSLRADVSWVDVPLSRVARDVASTFSMDVVFHPDVLDAQALVRLEGAALSLDAVAGALDDQLSAISRYDDGVIWVEPASEPASRPGQNQAPATARASAPVREAGMLGQPVSLAFTGGSPPALEEELSRVLGVRCRVEVGSGSVLPPITARGRLFEVLEAARMVEGWRWQVVRPTGPQGVVLILRLGAPDRPEK
ncbi:MAG: hypothetical protein HY718_19220 [Planctomycetes bacterium]|nr:hypothetical protein [Planctomycetota bacterium]